MEKNDGERYHNGPLGPMEVLWRSYRGTCKDLVRTLGGPVEDLPAYNHLKHYLLHTVPPSLIASKRIARSTSFSHKFFNHHKCH